MRAPLIAIVVIMLATVGGLCRGERAALAQAPSTAAASEREAFYRDVRLKQYAAAVTVGGAYHKQFPRDDRFALDYAYALLADHRTDEATTLLHRLAASSDVTVRSAASRQLAALAPPPVPAGAAPVAASTPSPFTNAYELLAGGDLGSARDAFVATLATNPGDAAAWHQLSYIDFVLNDRPAMIDALHHYIALRPDDDHAKLELAYALLAAGQRAEANEVLAGLTTSSDTEVAEAAQKQLAASRAGTGGKPQRVGVFGYAENDSRFHDTFYGIDGRYTIAPTRIEPYVAVHFSDDAKSSSVPATSILNDNVVIVSAGLRTKIAPIAYAFIEGGEAQSLLTGHLETDLRYGLLLSTRLGAGGRKPQTQIDASAVYYSRYLDAISYTNVAHDFYIGSKVVRGVVGINLALDTDRLYYNNAAEAFGGVQVRSGLFTVRVVGVAGTYLGRGIDPPERTYTSFRPVLLFGYSH